MFSAANIASKEQIKPVLSLKISIESSNACLVQLIWKKIKGVNQRFNAAKKVISTDCYSGKLKLTFTSPNIISTGPKNVLMSRIDFIVLL